MARSIETIYNELMTIKLSQPDLTDLTPNPSTAADLKNDLTSESVVAVWRLWLWIMAVATHTHELLFDKHILDVEAIHDGREWGTLKFLHDRTLLFQLGDAFDWNGVQFVYDPITPANQIVKRCAVVVSGFQVLFKVAKLDGNGDPEKLSVAEISALETYVDRIVYAGTQFVIISDDPDDVKVDLSLVFDPLIISPNGSLITDPAVFPVVDAINGFIKNLSFNGVVNITELVDYLQLIDGVVDPTMNSMSSKFGGYNYAPIVMNYHTFAGHAVLDEPNSIITYISENDV
tara:strand:+ start:594 stop:1460 length:867 start_codon:yes stop_codon:yes gene_type:complete